MATIQIDTLTRCVNGGYAKRYIPGRRWVGEHRLVMENKLGRPLLRGETVHHKDHNKLNNHPDNLELLTRSDHGRLHAPLLGTFETCPVCSSPFYRPASDARRGRGLVCSKKCAAYTPKRKANWKNLKFYGNNTNQN